MAEYEKRKIRFKCNHCGQMVGEVQAWKKLHPKNEEIEKDIELDIDLAFKCWHCGKWSKMIGF